MANYEAYARSNYFHVNNMKNFLKWMKMYLPDAHLFTKDNKKKEAITEQDLVAFGMESDVYLKDEDQAISSLQELLLEGEACVVMETGHEKLRYVAGHSTIFTKNTVEYVSLDEKTRSYCAELLGQPDYQLDISY